ncbi:aldo/keto reductase [Exiguobacterium antarcticum]|uniref:aldo/keto reductase n=1 Tax=Exiguobacterium antarcticum TaxID=132920 RepID=UPI000285EC50|nr:aldo/keto reductase [Exiguobacterium antarcticum]AFS69766.1 Aldo/keto reductase [Exiguobacterium antarcticum B7]
MELRSFGQTDIKVSPLGFGAGHIGSEALSDQEASYVLHQALDLGIRLFDTARGYGLSEKRIGHFLKQHRHDVVLSTKVGYDVPGADDWTFQAVAGGIDQALLTMQTDYIDIVHLHSCSKEILAQDDVIEALERAKQAGKVRLIAYSGDRDDLDYAITTGRFDSFQTSVNLYDQRVLADAVPEIHRQQKGIIAKRPLANAPWRFGPGRSGNMSNLIGNGHSNSNSRLKKLLGLKPHSGLPFFESGITSAIIGTANPEHLVQNIRLLEKGALPAKRITDLKRRFQEQDQNWLQQT